METLFHGGTDSALLFLILTLGWFIREMIKGIRSDIAFNKEEMQKIRGEMSEEVKEVSKKIDGHITNCAHVTPKERELSEKLETLRFEHISTNMQAVKDLLGSQIASHEKEIVGFRAFAHELRESGMWPKK